MNVAQRRTPKQTRSLKRVKLILDTARDLIGAQGADAVSVREIAATAEIPISSVYQYFPDKNAILRQPMMQYLEKVRAELMKAYASVRGPDDLAAASDRAIDAFVKTFRTEPALATIWAGVQASPDLRDLDAQDTRENAEFFTQTILALVPGAKKQDVADACLLITHIVGCTMQLVLTVDKKTGNRLIRQLKTMIRQRISQMIQRSTT